MGKDSGSGKASRFFDAFAKRLASPIDCGVSKAFSSEVDSGSREENASKQTNRVAVLILSELKQL